MKVKNNRNQVLSYLKNSIVNMTVYSLFILSFIETVHVITQNISIFLKIGHYLQLVFPFQLPLLAYFSLKLKNVERFQNLFNWKLYVIPLLFICAVSLGFWRFDSAITFNTRHILGFDWGWHAITFYSLCFLGVLFYFQKKVNASTGFLLSYMTVYLNGIIYELPLMIKGMHLIYNTVFIQMLPITLVTYICLLVKGGFRFTYAFLFGVISLVFGYLTFYFPIGASVSCIPYWGIRLIPIPLFLSIIYSMRAKNE